MVGTPARTRTGAHGLGNRCSILLSYRGKNYHVQYIKQGIPQCGETALITVWFHKQKDIDSTSGFTLAYVQEAEGGDTDSVHLTSLLVKKTQFVVEVVPAVGAVLLIERTTPSLLDTVMNLKWRKGGGRGSALLHGGEAAGERRVWDAVDVGADLEI